MLLSTVFFLSAHALASPSEEALSCVQTKTYEAFESGWSLRTREVLTRASVDLGIMPTTLVAGVSYQVVACGDPLTADVQLALYDAGGKLLQSDTVVARDAQLSVSVPSTGGYYVVARGVPTDGDATSVAVGLLYK